MTSRRPAVARCAGRGRSSRLRLAAAVAGRLPRVGVRPMKTIDDLGRPARHARARPHRPERPARHGDRPTITDDGRIRASVPTIAAAGRRRRAGGRRRTPRPTQGRAGGEVLAAPRRRAADASCSARRSPSPTDTVGESAQATVAALGDGERRAAGEPAVQRGRDEQGRRRARRLRRPARRAGRRLRQRRVRRRAPQAGQRVRRRAAAAARGRRAGAGRGRGAEAADRRRRRARTSSSSAARRCRTSSASSTTCWARPTGC